VTVCLLAAAASSTLCRPVRQQPGQTIHCRRAGRCTRDRAHRRAHSLHNALDRLGGQPCLRPEFATFQRTQSVVSGTGLDDHQGMPYVPSALQSTDAPSRASDWSDSSTAARCPQDPQERSRRAYGLPVSLPGRGHARPPSTERLSAASISASAPLGVSLRVQRERFLIGSCPVIGFEIEQDLWYCVRAFQFGCAFYGDRMPARSVPSSPRPEAPLDCSLALRLTMVMAVVHRLAGRVRMYRSRSLRRGPDRSTSVGGFALVLSRYYRR